MCNMMIDIFGLEECNYCWVIKDILAGEFSDMVSMMF